ncbi:lysine-rich arabinogalactan protein 19-like [Penaeus chinensis]|uniref:lysine-rich arabinogalactan protein 19-like n=1 Tax=Penaeus chinensis TaxID=139456 RepID=UPI001FB719E9|nr:lysine-rich arabinogalactan protein 19-like [Penaeus chinensis]
MPANRSPNVTQKRPQITPQPNVHTGLPSPTPSSQPTSTHPHTSSKGAPTPPTISSQSYRLPPKRNSSPLPATPPSSVTPPSHLSHQYTTRLTDANFPMCTRLRMKGQEQRGHQIAPAQTMTPSMRLSSTLASPSTTRWHRRRMRRQWTTLQDSRETRM